ncbi:solute:sodium symporter family transporter [Arenibacter sp. M-2]|uniref:solute:sodium symporter family transporter n=1 Tax=unclassified Arenibacter TaxID=2615047 RepID=UPI000D9A3861|nr:MULTISPECIES: solute:sodium symporter family transporter [unclassified Arenibacter]MDL5512100.1 solute:sodium symporter family transporter [Arenibacter sp. M-2]PXX26034.1 SSS family solute:Na+ symporter [Arenibacter sp. ARW7G5Y1]|tara:strand:- start:9243 stop:10841 length:1599 start_codon:yes stop_codon:yes gene_type:complete
MNSELIIILTSFLVFTGGVAFFTWYSLRKTNLTSSDGYFLGGRSLTGIVIAGSMLLTNISSEHLIGMNGNSYVNGFIVIAWEVTSSIALVIAAIFFVPKYLKMGLTTIPQFLESRFDGMTRTMVAAILIFSFVVTLLPIVLYSGAIGIESLFGVSETLGVSKSEGLWITVVIIGVIGSIYAIFGGLKAVAYSDTINGFGLLLGGLLIPILALMAIGDNNIWDGLVKVYEYAPEKFNVVGARDSVLPFEVLFTGLIINQLYFWGMNQTIIQRALGAKNLKEAQKGLLITGLFKILIPLIIVLPGVICYYYFQDTYFDQQDTVYPQLVKKVLPVWLIGFFAAVIMGAVLSTFNSVLNSVATLFSMDIYKKHIAKDVSDTKLVRIGKVTSAILAVMAIFAAPMVANASDGLYQLLQELNGIFFIPIASILLAGFFMKKVSATGAKVALIFGLCFYIFMTWGYTSHGIHFVHLWGIEFLLNVAIMYSVSHFYPNRNKYEITDVGAVNLTTWKYTIPMSIGLCAVTILIYVLLWNNQ